MRSMLKTTYFVAVICHVDHYASKCRKCFFFPLAWLVMSQSFLGVCSLFYITGHLVISTVLSQLWCFISSREGRGFNLEARPQTSGKINYINVWWKDKSNPQDRSQQFRINKCEICPQHPHWHLVLSNGQNDVTSGVTVNIMLLNGPIWTHYLMTRMTNSVYHQAPVNPEGQKYSFKDPDSNFLYLQTLPNSKLGE